MSRSAGFWWNSETYREESRESGWERKSESEWDRVREREMEDVRQGKDSRKWAVIQLDMTWGDLIEWKREKKRSSLSLTWMISALPPRSSLSIVVATSMPNNGWRKGIVEWVGSWVELSWVEKLEKKSKVGRRRKMRRGVKKGRGWA